MYEDMAEFKTVLIFLKLQTIVLHFINVTIFYELNQLHLNSYYMNLKTLIFIHNL